jgi:hypothetical protein
MSERHDDLVVGVLTKVNSAHAERARSQHLSEVDSGPQPQANNTRVCPSHSRRDRPRTRGNEPPLPFFERVCKCAFGLVCRWGGIDVLLINPSPCS